MRGTLRKIKDWKTIVEMGGGKRHLSIKSSREKTIRKKNKLISLNADSKQPKFIDISKAPSNMRRMIKPPS